MTFAAKHLRPEGGEKTQSVTKEDAKAYFEISPTNIGETAKIIEIKKEA